MAFRPSVSLRVFGTALLCTACTVTAAQGLPAEVAAALDRARIPRDAVAMLVVDAEAPDGATKPPRLEHRSTAAMNPASVMKLVTTYAALDLLGPAYMWTTPVFVDGPVREGVLRGNLYIKGQGDPKLVVERLWLLLRRVQGLGVTSIAGDIVLDRSAFDVPDTDPGQFDGERLRPYNASPDALLINYKSVVLTFTPDLAGLVARVQVDPPLAGVQVSSTVKLSGEACGDYRGALRAEFDDPARIRFAGAYQADCGEKVWPVAYSEPKAYSLRAVQGLWQSMGGTLTGSVRFGTVPEALAAGMPAFELQSPALADVIRDINKYSNNLMAQQLFLTLGRAGATDAGNFDNARAAVLRWWAERLGPLEAPVLDNGSGLSRRERISAIALGRMLQHAWRSPLMPELLSSLPVAGVDGTMRRFKSRATGSAHLKTGSLANVAAVAGFVHAASGKRYVLVAMVNHANANQARAAFDALTEWTQKDQ